MGFVFGVLREFIKSLRNMAGYFINDRKKRNFFFILIVSIILVYLSVSCVIYLLMDGKIMYGVNVNEINLGGKTKEQASDIIRQLYGKIYSDKKILLNYKNHRLLEFMYTDLSIEVDYDATAAACYLKGRQGSSFMNILSVLKRFFTKDNVPVVLSYDYDKLKEKVENLNNEVLNSESFYKINLEEKTLTIFCKAFDEIIDGELSSQKIIESIRSGTGAQVYLELVKSDNYIAKSNFLYERVNTLPKDASYKIENNSLHILPEVRGVEINKYEIIESFKKNPEIIVSAIEIINPEITKEKLESLIFRDVLSEYTTDFNPNSVGRVNNIEVASEKIDGKILDAGQSFSFNDIVGKRGYEEGFVDGKVFFDGKVTDGVGGGICQVSSTIYNAAVLADLEILSRSPHSFAVSYVPKGQDATVAYNYIDLKFTNSREFPVKIFVDVVQSQVIVKILGTNFTPDKTIEIENVIKDTLPFKIVYEESDDEIESIEADSDHFIKQKGVEGCTVETFKVIKESGEELKRESLGISVYKAMNEIVVIPKIKTKEQ